VLIKRLYPSTDVVGLDPDPKAVGRAEKKAARAHASVRFDRGFSDRLSYDDASFDRVLSSLMFHHLEPDRRAATLHEVRRVLMPGGSFHMLDFSASDHAHHGLARLFHCAHQLKDNSDSRILALMKQAGFAQPKKVSDGKMLFGLMTVGYFQGTLPT
jgi:ubiquinone/menaquinone biosynthesis C-methylase UbiE